MILSAHTSNGGPIIARPEPLSTRRMLKLLRRRLDKVAIGKLSQKKCGVREVHRLRVATRRARAALFVCKPLLSKSVVRELQKTLKLQRKALGAVRDWDVLIAHVLCTPADEKADLRTDLLFYLARERKRVWRDACRAWEKAGTVKSNESKFRKSNRTLGAETAHDLFRRAVREPLATIREAATTTHDRGAVDMKSLHTFRIACKELRYLLEYRQEVTGEADTLHKLSPAMDILTEAQQRLGDLHDWSRRPELLRAAHRAANQGVRNWVETAIAKAETRLPGEIERYLAWQEEANFTGALCDLGA